MVERSLARSASHSASLFIAGKSIIMALSWRTPQGVTKTTIAPVPWLLEAPSTCSHQISSWNKCQDLLASWYSRKSWVGQISVCSVGAPGVSSAIKSVSTWALIAVHGSYWMSKLASSTAHGDTRFERSAFLKSAFNRNSVRTTIKWVWK